MNSKKTIELANQFLSKFSINRYVEKPLQELDLNKETITGYLNNENLYFDLNELNPLVFLGKISCEDIFGSINLFVKNHQLDETIYYNHLMETLIYIEKNNNQNEFLEYVNEMLITSGYTIDTFEDILQCLVIRNDDMDLGDQLPVSTFFQACLCLTDKAKAMKGTV